jgi:uncharacterized protein YdhG (YjbR/CyaY superfamily)
MHKSFKNIDDYIQSQPSEIRELLVRVRTTIQEAAPDAKEDIKYGMPTFILNKNLVHFAANKNHIGFYPSPSGIIQFTEELKPYKTSIGAIQFPFDKEIPLELIGKITRFRVNEELIKMKIIR